MRASRERPIHIAILGYLRLRFPDAVTFHVPNELNLGGNPRAKAIAQRRAKELGMLPGAPDLIMCLNGRFWSFEVKAEGGRQTDHQMAAGMAIQAAGGRYAVVRSIDDVEACLSEWERETALVPLRGVVT